MNYTQSESYSGFENFEKLIKSYDSFIISAHESPDADGIGSEIALKHLLEKLDKEVIIVNQDRTPKKNIFMDIDKEIIQYELLSDQEKKLKLTDNYIKNSALIICDSSNIDRIGKIKDNFKTKVKSLFVIDHHMPLSNFKFNSYIDTEAIATACIIYRLYKHFNIDFNFKVSQALYAAIIVDSGSFRFERTNSETHTIASELLKHNVDPTIVYRNMYQSYSLNRTMLMSKVFSNIKLEFEGKVAILKMPYEIYINSGIDYDEVDDFVNLPLEAKDTYISIFLKEPEKNRVKVSFRSREKYDVQVIASNFNGGGHKRAAGCYIDLSMDEAEKALTDYIRDNFKF